MRRTDREVTDAKAIAEIIESAKICHLAVQDETEPYIVPLSYGYQFGDGILTLYFHSAVVGKKINLFRQRKRVCFEISNWREPEYDGDKCRIDYGYSSVIGYGNVEFIEKMEEKCLAMSCINEHQMKRSVSINEMQAKSLCIYKIETDTFSAKSTGI